VTRRIRRWPFAPLLLAAIFATALWAPIPTAPDAARARVMAQVGERFPGWRIARAKPSWEGAWAVVINCGRRQVGFQLIPGHGLPAGDAWLHPEDSYSHARLAAISDDRAYLVWYREGERVPSSRCRTELARSPAEWRRHLSD
jgi:hypothetical protein